MYFADTAVSTCAACGSLWEVSPGCFSNSKVLTCVMSTHIKAGVHILRGHCAAACLRGQLSIGVCMMMCFIVVTWDRVCSAPKVPPSLSLVSNISTALGDKLRLYKCLQSQQCAPEGELGTQDACSLVIKRPQSTTHCVE